MLLIGSAVMNNVRQIHRYLVRQRADETNKAGQRTAEHIPGSLLFLFCPLSKRDYWLGFAPYASCNQFSPIERNVISEESGIPH
jgi:hypothetical protein